MRMVVLASLTVGACTNTTSDPMENQTAQTVAMAQESSDSIVVAFAGRGHGDQLDEVLSEAKPRTFPWTVVTIPSSRSTEVRSAEGLVADLTDAATGVRWMQVYDSVCNPAIDDNRACLIYEEYNAGDVGLSGVVRLKLTPTSAFGSFEVNWEGITDRFGAPSQKLGISTTTAYAASLVTKEGTAQ